ncbi:class I SAM-dependent methyltransferase [Shewanella surugensis]|uniref:Protein N-lysine methyltransferase family protein n=1 Tax=Shewanella surugensis TaxID=212020 RepID=A0ABT0LCE1_9GAMM|nr:protein N-lysine methyltransferase family protein [Shewanella surugensis]MCL1125372.1 protein N-lysine methyltransferase family protein [Shewanella surugensis]
MTACSLRYQTLEFDNIDIHLRTLKDRNQFDDPQGEAKALGISSAQWPLFGVIWDSSQILAHEMEHFSIHNKRILEVGCGIALSSVLLKRLNANITATDYHPEAERFLQENIKLNQSGDIPFLRTNWNNQKDTLGTFDLIIGSDLLYEKEHITLLSAFIHRHANPHCEVIIVDPGRGNHAAFSKQMTLLNYSHTQHLPKNSHYLSHPFKGKILHYQHQD